MQRKVVYLDQVDIHLVLRVDKVFFLLGYSLNFVTLLAFYREYNTFRNLTGIELYSRLLLW